MSWPSEPVRAVLDLDTIKSSLLDAGLDWEGSSRGSYAAIYALVDDLLSIDGAGVIVDTPSYWPEIGARRHRRRETGTVRSTSSWSVSPPRRFVRSVSRTARVVAARSPGPARTRQMRRRSWTTCIDDRSTVRLTRPVLWCEPTNRWTCRASLPPAGSRRSRTRGSGPDNS